MDNLQRQGFEAYLPVIRQRRRWRGAYRAVVEPMFPRYLFIRLDDTSDNWKPIRSTFGVARLISFGDTAASVPDSLIDALRCNEDEAGVQRSAERMLRKGEPVVITSGAMEGYQAVFEAATGRERVVVLLDIAGRAVPISVPASEIEPLR